MLTRRLLTALRRAESWPAGGMLVCDAMIGPMQFALTETEAVSLTRTGRGRWVGEFMTAEQPTAGVIALRSVAACVPLGEVPAANMEQAQLFFYKLALRIEGPTRAARWAMHQHLYSNTVTVCGMSGQPGPNARRSADGYIEAFGPAAVAFGTPMVVGCTVHAVSAWVDHRGNDAPIGVALVERKWMIEGLTTICKADSAGHHERVRLSVEHPLADDAVLSVQVELAARQRVYAVAFTTTPPLH